MFNSIIREWFNSTIIDWGQLLNSIIFDFEQLFNSIIRQLFISTIIDWDNYSIQ